jgi:hypothetical protein
MEKVKRIMPPEIAANLPRDLKLDIGLAPCLLRIFATRDFAACPAKEETSALKDDSENGWGLGIRVTTLTEGVLNARKLAQIRTNARDAT